MNRRKVLAYLLCPLAGPLVFAIVGSIRAGVNFEGAFLAFFFMGGASFVLTAIFGWPALVVLGWRRKNAWWHYVVTGVAIGLVFSLVIVMLGDVYRTVQSAIVLCAAINALAFWVIGVRTNLSIQTTGPKQPAAD